MKILGISGSARDPETSGVYKVVKTVLDATGCDYELISLRGKKICGCIACLGCVKDNECKVQDDMTALRDRSSKGLSQKPTKTPTGTAFASISPDATRTPS